MIRYILAINIILFLIISQDIKSQDTITIYFDDQWNQCDKELSSYYRKYYKTEQKEYNVWDFRNSGQLQMTGTYKKRNWKEKTGHFTYYYENGQKESEGKYFEDKKTGKWTRWYEIGIKESEGVFIDDKLNGKLTSWYENGNIRSEAEYKYGELISLTKAFDEEGYFINEYAEDPKLLDNYSDYESSIIDFMKFLGDNIYYPEQAKKNGQQGKVFVSFYIDVNGNVYNTKILKGVSEDIDNEALRVIKLFQWPSPKYKGKEILLKLTTPINFTMN